ncbi:MAG TPA: FAD-dependent monooxygenase [Thermoanaerobaculia bacterium]|nr:FAD-dependent monooxygenase [Thermoanaerobaculia bacterium]
MTGRWDAVVVGAGPAGSAAATVLARLGRSVLLLEKDVFPRHKVCGEFLSADSLPSLEILGARDAVERATTERMTRGTLHLSRGKPVSFELPAPALGLSRFRFDDLLARGASEAGAQVRFGARVLAAAPDGRDAFRVRFVHEQAESDVEARSVVGAWGRWDALDRTLERRFLGRRSRFFGWSRDFHAERGRLEGEVRLYLFAGGYCGLSRVEDGTVNLAGVVSDRAWSRAGGGWEAVVQAARRGNAALDSDLAAMTTGPIGYLGTGPVFFTAKPATENRILMAGDAAGVIDPFSGEGQAAALASGILAAQTVERRLSGGLSSDACARAYEAAWRRRFARRFAWSALFRRLILHETIGAIAGRLAGERLVRFAIRATRR